MRPRDRRESGMEDLFGMKLKDFINMKHSMVKLSSLIDWGMLEEKLAKNYVNFGRPGLPTRLTVGLHILKYMYGLSDEEVCEMWVENPYFQYFCGEEHFQHELRMDRSSLTRFRGRVGEEAMEAILQSSLEAAFKSGSLKLKDLRKVAIDTTVQEKAISYPSLPKLLRKAGEKLRAVAKKAGVKLRQSYSKILRRAEIMAGRYTHAKQMRRAKKQIKLMRSRVGRLVRDLERKVESLAVSISEELKQDLQAVIVKAWRISKQEKGDCDYIYSWHEAEVECIGKGKSRSPYEFGCKVSMATNIEARGGKHYILHAKALHGRPYDGHTLAKAIDNIKELVGNEPEQVFVDKGYKGHGIKGGNTRVYISGQKRGITSKIAKDLKRRSVIEPIIGHAKEDGLLSRNYLKGKQGDKINAVMAAAGFNFRQIVSYLKTYTPKTLLAY